MENTKADILRRFLLDNFLLNRNTKNVSVDIEVVSHFIRNCLTGDSSLKLLKIVPHTLLRKNAKLLNFLISVRVVGTIFKYCFMVGILSFIFNTYFLVAFNKEDIENGPLIFWVLSTFVFLPTFVLAALRLFLKKFVL